MPEKSRLRRSISRWANPSHEEAVSVRRESQRSGNVSIAEAPNRELVTVTGTLTVLWLGRRHIGGVHPGRNISVTARIGEHEGRRIMYNPRYSLGY